MHFCLQIEDVLEEQKTAEVAKAELKGTIGFEKAPDTEKVGMRHNNFYLLRDVILLPC